LLPTIYRWHLFLPTSRLSPRWSQRFDGYKNPILLARG